MAVQKKQLWGWYFFDWASQPYSTLILTFVFSPYFADVARTHYMTQGMAEAAAGAEAQALWGYGQTASGLLIAVLAPLLGAIADGSGRRMPWIWACSVIYVIGSLGLWFLVPTQPPLIFALICFSIGLIGVEFATIFTNSLMPQIADADDMGEISGTGFAFGYFGGIISLIIALCFFVESGNSGTTLIGLPPILGLDAAAREGTRAIGPFTALWYMVFMIPFFMWVKEPATPIKGPKIGAAMVDLGRLLASLPTRKSLFAYLMSSMFYRDSLNALYGFGGVYAIGVLGWSVTQIGIFGIIGAISGGIAAWIGGKLDKYHGPKPVIVGSVWILIIVCTMILSLTPYSFFGIEFAENSPFPDYVMYFCGIMIGAAGGTVQAASRTMMVRHTTPERASEAFGLFALSGKATSFIAPLAIALASDMSGSQRIGIAPLIGLFLISLYLLIWVNPKGDQQ